MGPGMMGGGGGGLDPLAMKRKRDEAVAKQDAQAKLATQSQASQQPQDVSKFAYKQESAPAQGSGGTQVAQPGFADTSAIYQKQLDRAKQDINSQTQSGEDALKRRYAALGAVNSGSHLKQLETLHGNAASEIEKAGEDVSARQMQEKARQAEILQGQGYSSGESALGRQFSGSEAQKGREFASGESALGRQFSGSEAEKGRVFQTGEREETQKYGTGERKETQAYTSKEAEKVREFQAGQSEKAYQQTKSLADLADVRHMRDLDIESKWKEREFNADNAYKNATLANTAKEFERDNVTLAFNAATEALKNGDYDTLAEALNDMNPKYGVPGNYTPRPSGYTSTGQSIYGGGGYSQSEVNNMKMFGGG